MVSPAHVTKPSLKHFNNSAQLNFRLRHLPHQSRTLASAFNPASENHEEPGPKATSSIHRNPASCSRRRNHLRDSRLHRQTHCRSPAIRPQAPSRRQRWLRGRRPAPRRRVRRPPHRQPRRPPRHRSHHRHLHPHRRRQRLRLRPSLLPPDRSHRSARRRLPRHLHLRKLEEHRQGPPPGQNDRHRHHRLLRQRRRSHGPPMRLQHRHPLRRHHEHPGVAPRPRAHLLHARRTLHLRPRLRQEAPDPQRVISLLQITLQPSQQLHRRPCILADPAVIDLLHRNHVQIVPPATPTPLHNHQVRTLEHPQVLHHRATVHPLEVRTKLPRRLRPILQQIQNLPPPVI